MAKSRNCLELIHHQLLVALLSVAQWWQCNNSSTEFYSNHAWTLTLDVLLEQEELTRNDEIVDIHQLSVRVHSVPSNKQTWAAWWHPLLSDSYHNESPQDEIFGICSAIFGNSKCKWRTTLLTDSSRDCINYLTWSDSMYFCWLVTPRANCNMTESLFDYLSFLCLISRP